MSGSDSSKQQVVILIEGWLFKQGVRFKSWRRRYFVLDGAKLSYAKDLHKTPIDSLHVENVKEVVLEPTPFKGAPVAYASFGLSIITPHRTYHIVAETDSEKRRWYEALVMWQLEYISQRAAELPTSVPPPLSAPEPIVSSVTAAMKLAEVNANANEMTTEYSQTPIAACGSEPQSESQLDSEVLEPSQPTQMIENLPTLPMHEHSDIPSIVVTITTTTSSDSCEQIVVALHVAAAEGRTETTHSEFESLCRLECSTTSGPTDTATTTKLDADQSAQLTIETCPEHPCAIQVVDLVDPFGQSKTQEESNPKNCTIALSDECQQTASPLTSPSSSKSVRSSGKEIAVAVPLDANGHTMNRKAVVSERPQDISLLSLDQNVHVTRLSTDMMDIPMYEDSGLEESDVAPHSPARFSQRLSTADVIRGKLVATRSVGFKQSLSVVVGSPNDQPVDALIVSAAPDLAFESTVLQEIEKEGGEEISRECSNHISSLCRSLRPGERFLSTGGKLRAKHVAHVVGLNSWSAPTTNQPSPLLSPSQPHVALTLSQTPPSASSPVSATALVEPSETALEAQVQWDPLAAIQDTLKALDELGCVFVAFAPLLSPTPSATATTAPSPSDRCSQLVRAVRSFLELNAVNMVGVVFVEANERDAETMQRAIEQVVADARESVQPSEEETTTTVAGSLLFATSPAPKRFLRVVKGRFWEDAVDLLVVPARADLRCNWGPAEICNKKGGKKIDAHCASHISSLGRNLEPGESFLSQAGGLRAKGILHVVGTLESQQRGKSLWSKSGNSTSRSSTFHTEFVVTPPPPSPSQLPQTDSRFSFMSFKSSSSSPNFADSTHQQQQHGFLWIPCEPLPQRVGSAPGLLTAKAMSARKIIELALTRADESGASAITFGPLSAVRSYAMYGHPKEKGQEWIKLARKVFDACLSFLHHDASNLTDIRLYEEDEKLANQLCEIAQSCACFDAHVANAVVLSPPASPALSSASGGGVRSSASSENLVGQTNTEKDHGMFKPRSVGDLLRPSPPPPPCQPSPTAAPTALPISPHHYYVNDPHSYQYNEEPDGPENIETEIPADGSSTVPLIRSGTLQKLIEKLTNHEHFDNNYLYAFLLTYRSFTRPEELFEMLVERYNIPPPADAPFEAFLKERLDRVRLRIGQVLKFWIERHFYDWKDNEPMQSRLRDLLEDMRVTQKRALADSLEAVLRRKIEQCDEDSRSMPITVGENELPTPILPRGWTWPTIDQSSLATTILTEFHARELARHLTLIEYDLFKRIQPKECLNQSWNKQNRETQAKNIFDMIQRFNQVCFWVASEIVKIKDLKRRIKMVEKMISIAEELFDLNNMNGMYEVIAGLNTAAVKRLKRTWEGVSQKSETVFAELNTLVSRDKNFSGMRSHLPRVNPPCIPYLGLYLTDLTFIEVGNQDTTNGRINFVKRRKLAKVIKDLQVHQQTPYKLQEVPELREALQNVSSPFNENELYEESLLREESQRKPTAPLVVESS